jgi:hypothetical protein
MYTTESVRWLDEWIGLKATLAIANVDTLTYPFFGFQPGGFREASSPLLYICTSVPGHTGGLSENGQRPFTNDPEFQSFGIKLSRIAESRDDSMSNMTITSICKLGVDKGEPGPALIFAQQQLAVQTLRCEMYATYSRLIVVACDGPFTPVMLETLNAGRGSEYDFQFHEDGDKGFSSRPRTKDWQPPVLWIQSPQGKSESVQNAWLQKAAELLK